MIVVNSRHGSVLTPLALVVTELVILLQVGGLIRRSCPYRVSF